MIYKNYTITAINVGRGEVYVVRYWGNENVFKSVAQAMDFIDSIGGKL